MRPLLPVLPLVILLTKGLPAYALEPEAKLETFINPAGTHITVLAPIVIRGVFCKPGFVSFGADLRTHLYNQLLQQYEPEALSLRIGTLERPAANEVAAIDGFPWRLTATAEPAARGDCNPYWERRISLTRAQVENLAAGATPRTAIRIGDLEFLLGEPSLLALRELRKLLQPASDFQNLIAGVQPFEGFLDAGSAYAGEIRFVKDTGWTLVNPPARIMAHHAMRVDWDVSGVSQLANQTGHHRVIFRVTSRETRAAGPSRWNTEIECRVLRYLGPR